MARCKVVEIGGTNMSVYRIKYPHV